MKKAMQVALGILTGIGGFFDIGNIATMTQAGAHFRFQLLWALVLGTLCCIFLVEMSGRFSAISKHAIGDAMRERLGLNFYVVPLIVQIIVNTMILGAELGGVALALQFITGVSMRIWAIPVAVVIWLVLWLGTFDVIENGSALLGLITIAFVVAAIKLHPDYGALAHSIVPSLPHDDKARYWFIAVSIMGAVVTPFLFYFYSSGALEDEWDESYLWVNRIVAVIGMGFGSFISMGALVVAALVLSPQGIAVDSYEQTAMMLIPALPKWGFALFVAGMAIACMGAALELSLAIAYTIAQGVGWHFGESLKPKDDSRFALTYTVVLCIAPLFIAIGIDPLKLTMFTMALVALILPLVIVPFLLIMNDKTYLKEHVNGKVTNVIMIVISILVCIVAAVSIPLEVIGGS